MLSLYYHSQRQQDKTTIRQDKTATRQDKINHKTKPDKTIQHETRQDNNMTRPPQDNHKTRQPQDKTKQDKTRQDKTIIRQDNRKTKTKGLLPLPKTKMTNYPEPEP